MRLLLTALLVLSGSAALAFNSARWQAKRADMTRDAERLRAAFATCASQAKDPATDVTIPVDTFADGSVKTLVSAQKAQYFLSSGLIWAENVTIRKYEADGRVESELKADACVVDRSTKSGWIEGQGELTRGKTVFRGKGVYFSSPRGYVAVLDGSEIVSRDLRFGEVSR